MGNRVGQNGYTILPTYRQDAIPILVNTVGFHKMYYNYAL